MELILGVFVLIVGQAMLQPPTAADPITVGIPMNDTAANLTNVNMNATSVNATAISVCNNTHQYCCREFPDVPTLEGLYDAMSDSVYYLEERCTNRTFKNKVS